MLKDKRESRRNGSGVKVTEADRTEKPNPTPWACVTVAVSNPFSLSLCYLLPSSLPHVIVHRSPFSSPIATKLLSLSLSLSLSHVLVAEPFSLLGEHGLHLLRRTQLPRLSLPSRIRFLCFSFLFFSSSSLFSRSKTHWYVYILVSFPSSSSSSSFCMWVCL